MIRRIPTLLALIPTLALLACGGDDVGTLEVTTWGEDFIEQGIPASAFEDGWSVTYDEFVVNLGAITAAGENFPGFQTVDLTQPGPHVLVSTETGARAIAPVAYSIAPVDAAAQNLNADAATVDTMRQNGYSVFLKGTATKDGSTITFEWGFDFTVDFHDCEATDAVPTGGTGTTQLTIHGDHLFYPSLTDPEVGLHFQTLADQDTDHDGVLSPDELRALSGTAFAALDHFDVPAGTQIDNLWEFLSAAASTIGHIDGEGHCHFEF